MPTKDDIREILLKVIEDLQPKGPHNSSLQQNLVLNEVKCRLVGDHVPAQELSEAILTAWYDLFRTGYLSPGLNLMNPDLPFFHITYVGHRALSALSRDPGNPAGYLRHLASCTTLNPITESYLKEGLDCFVAGFDKAAAVMIGACAESLILEMRDSITHKLAELKHPIPKDLNDWKFKTIHEAEASFFNKYKASFPRSLQEEYEAYWSALTQQIRAVRNEAGHPISVDPVTHDSVRASFLIFPELAKLVGKLKAWIDTELQTLGK